MRLTIEQLIEKLKRYPADSTVFVDDSDGYCFDISEIYVSPDDNVILSIDSASKYKEKKVVVEPIDPRYLK
ncbi:hypothetical protein JYQ62_08380 [Nostoc sp. UHCC 0702]|nr:hypothetical protein JYQ62_08380 [Nostoc sp. UHCC 0702]